MVEISGNKIKSNFSSSSFQYHPNLFINNEDQFLINKNILQWYKNGIIIKEFTCNGNIIKVQWCQFINNNNDQEYYLCILFNNGVILHSLKGKQIDIILPCKMDSFWVIPNGLLFQRSINNNNDDNIPVFFSLLDVLEEVKPLSYLSTNHKTLLNSDNIPIPFSSFIKNSSILHELSMSFTEDMDISGLFEDADFICDYINIIFSSIHLPIIITDNNNGKLSFWIIHNKNNPYNQCSYESAQQFAILRSQYEEEKRKQKLVDNINMNNDDLESSFLYINQSSIFQEDSFTLDIDAQIKAQVYLEWIADFNCPNKISNTFYITNREGNIYIYCFYKQIQLLQRYTLSYNNERYSVILDQEINNIKSVIPILCNNSYLESSYIQDIPGLDVFSKQYYQIQPQHLLIINSNNKISLYYDKYQLLSLDLPLNLLDKQCFPISLSNSVGNRFTLESNNNKKYRCSISLLFNNSILEDIIEALYSYIPHSTVRLLLIQILSNNTINSWEYFCSILLNTFNSNIKQDNNELSDWNKLLNSSFHLKEQDKYSLFKEENINYQKSLVTIHSIKQDDILPYIEDIHKCLHLLYESYKLDIKRWNDSEILLLDLLIPLSNIFSLNEYIDYYYRHIGIKIEYCKYYHSQKHLEKYISNIYRNKPLNIMFLIENILQHKDPKYLEEFNNSIHIPKSLHPSYNYLRIICRIYNVLGGGDISKFTYLNSNNTTNNNLKTNINNNDIPIHEQFTGNITNHAISLIAAGASFPILTSLVKDNIIDKNITQKYSSIYEQIILIIVEENIILKDLDNIPIGICLPIREAIFNCSNNPPYNWPYKAFTLIGREDLGRNWLMCNYPEKYAEKSKPLPMKEVKGDVLDIEQDITSRILDGTQFEDPITFLRFSKDNRLNELINLLSSSLPQIIEISDSTVSEHELLSLHQQQLHKISQRTMSLPIGRGMYTLSTTSVIGTETVPIPILELSGKCKDSNSLLKLTNPEDGGDMPENFDAFPRFHNGTAAALRITPNQHLKSNTWISYNKPETPCNSHGGFLLGLGLQGHLKALKLTKVVQYLTENHNLTNIGLLIGLACSYIGSMDVNIAKLLSVHIPALHPPSSSAVDVIPNTQIASIVSIGLLYMKTQHRGMTEMLLNEINHEPSTDCNFHRESYALASGFALGFIILGKGNKCFVLSDLQLEDRLMEYIYGNNEKPTYLESKKSSMKSLINNTDNTSLVLEDKNINTDITASGAIFAYGLLYLQTNNKDAADKLKLPNTIYLLESIRPDILLIRILCQNIIQWDSIQANSIWINSQIPLIIQQYINNIKLNNKYDKTVYQSYIHILAGCCLSIGLRYAGTYSQEAYNLILSYINIIKSFKTKKLNNGELLNKSMVETCLSNTFISLSLVMAGSGNLNCLQLFRKYYKRKLEPEITYGHHMALSMSLGFLFLGGGKYSINRTPQSIATLLCSIYPLYPQYANDNRYHLQALRHLYVLSCSNRCLEVYDIDTKLPCVIPIEITLKETLYYAKTKIQMIAPCIIPEIHEIQKITISTPRYYSIKFNIYKDINIYNFINNIKKIYVKRKSGYLSYIDDPEGLKNIFSRSFPKLYNNNNDNNNISNDLYNTYQLNKSKFIQAFSGGDDNILEFVNIFCNSSINNNNNSFSEYSNIYTCIIYECLSNESPEILFIYINILYILQNMDLLGLWNIKLILSFYEYYYKNNNNITKSLIQQQFITSIQMIIKDKLKIKNISSIFSSYINNNHYNNHSLSLLPSYFPLYLIYNDIPNINILKNIMKYWNDKNLLLEKKIEKLYFILSQSLLFRTKSIIYLIKLFENHEEELIK